MLVEVILDHFLLHSPSQEDEPPPPTHVLKRILKINSFLTFINDENIFVFLDSISFHKQRS